MKPAGNGDIDPVVAAVMARGIPQDVLHVSLVCYRLISVGRSGSGPRVESALCGEVGARRIKLLADIASNTDPNRLALVTDKTRIALTQKYAEATRHLTTG